MYNDCTQCHYYQEEQKIKEERERQKNLFIINEALLAVLNETPKTVFTLSTEILQIDRFKTIEYMFTPSMLSYALRKNDNINIIPEIKSVMVFDDKRNMEVERSVYYFSIKREK